MIDGVTTTRLYPSNEKLIAHGKRLDPPPTKVYRRLNFVDGIPAEYDWTGVTDETHRRLGGLALQRMSVAMWLRIIEREAQSGTGHIGPVVNLPHPDRECECEACTQAGAWWDEQIDLAAREERPTDEDAILKHLYESGAL